MTHSKKDRKETNSHFQFPYFYLIFNKNSTKTEIQEKNVCIYGKNGYDF